MSTRRRIGAVMAAGVTMVTLGAVAPTGAAAAQPDPGYDPTLPCSLQETAEETRSCLLDTSPGYVRKLLGDSYNF